MSAQTSMLHIRVEDALKAQATQTLEAIGLSVSDAVRLFLRRVVTDQAFPLELKVPNAETRAAMEESRAMMAAREQERNTEIEAVRQALIAGERSGEPQRFDFAEFTRRKLAQYAS